MLPAFSRDPAPGGPSHHRRARSEQRPDAQGALVRLRRAGIARAALAREDRLRPLQRQRRGHHAHRPRRAGRRGRPPVAAVHVRVHEMVDRVHAGPRHLDVQALRRHRACKALRGRLVHRRERLLLACGGGVQGVPEFGVHRLLVHDDDRCRRALANRHGHPRRRLLDKGVEGPKRIRDQRRRLPRAGEGRRVRLRRCVRLSHRRPLLHPVGQVRRRADVQQLREPAAGGRQARRRAVRMQVLRRPVPHRRRGGGVRQAAAHLAGRDG